MRGRHRGESMKETILADGETGKKGGLGKYRGDNIVERAWRGTLKGHKKDKEVKT